MLLHPQGDPVGTTRAALATGAYPGTCRDLTDDELGERRDSGRPPAIRLRSDVTQFTIRDDLCGEFTGVVDDFVLRRGDESRPTTSPWSSTTRTATSTRWSVPTTC